MFINLTEMLKNYQVCKQSDVDYNVLHFSATTAATATPATANNCRRINRPNMRYFCRNSSSHGYFCTIRCNSGYTLKGARRVTCENGRFSPSIENNRCEKSKCLYFKA